MKQWWFSFSGPSGAAGVVVAEGEDFMSAFIKLSLAGLNPGGEVMAVEVPEPHRYAPEHLNRLLSPVEAVEVLGASVYTSA